MAVPGLSVAGALALPLRIPALAIGAANPRARAESLLDRIVRGRAWIPVLALLLVGIVAMQVEVLKLGASTGRSMNTATELSSEIQRDRAAVSALASPARIERIAETYGLTQPGPTDYNFVHAGTSAEKAIHSIHPVDAAGFAANLAALKAQDATVSPQAVQAANNVDTGVIPTGSDTSSSDPTATGTTDPSAAASDASSATDPSVPATTDAAVSTPTDPAATSDTSDTTGVAANTPTDPAADTSAPSTAVAASTATAATSASTGGSGF